MPDSDQLIRPARDVAQRCLVLYGVVAVAHQELRENVISWLTTEGLWEAVSPKEKAFLTSPAASNEDMINAGWRAEALWVLLWALGEVEDLGAPEEVCDLSKIHTVFRACEGSAAKFVNGARLRSDEEIFSKEFEVYDSHWVIRDAELYAKELPKGLNPDIIQERHYALNWLTYDVHWDDVTTDT